MEVDLRIFLMDKVFSFVILWVILIVFVGFVVRYGLFVFNIICLRGMNWVVFWIDLFV